MIRAISLCAVVSALPNCILYSQTTNYSHHDAHTITFNVVSSGDRAYYLERSMPIGTCCKDYANVVCIDTAGLVAFRTTIAVNPWLSDGRIKRTYDGNILAVAGTVVKHCDVGGNEFNISKLDASGNILFNITVGAKVTDIVPWPDGTFYFTDESNLHHYSATGQPLQSVSLGSVVVNCAARSSNGSLVVSCWNSVGIRLRRIDTLGNTISDASASQLFSLLREAPDGTIYGLGSGQMNRLTSSFSLMYTSFPTLSSVTINDFDIRNDSLFVTGKVNPSGLAYVVLTNSLNPLYQATSNVENATGTGIAIHTSNHVSLITHGSTSLVPSHRFSGYFYIPVFGNIQSKPDIGVTTYTVLSASVSTVGYSWISNADLQVTVKNFGTLPVNHFKLNSYAYIGGTSYCYIGLQKSFTTTILPGDSAVVNTGHFYCQPTTTAMASGSIIPGSLCVHTSVPDNQNDIELTNDFLCKTVNFVITGIDQQTENEKVAVYPNPFSDVLTVSSPVEMESVSLYAADGSLVSFTPAHCRELTLRANKAKPGIYILRISDKNGSSYKKVLIE